MDNYDKDSMITSLRNVFPILPTGKSLTVFPFEFWCFHP